MYESAFLRTLLLAAFFAAAALAQSAFALESHAATPENEAAAPGVGDRVQRMIDDALGLVGIRYRRGGSSAETGFDCSGFVGFVMLESLGLKLPRTSREISRAGAPVAKTDLEPGDLVFFNTMRRAFSHVGIYLGDNQFVHAPRSGQKVRVEDMRESYWAKRYNGARRIGVE